MVSKQRNTEFRIIANLLLFGVVAFLLSGALLFVAANGPSSVRKILVGYGFDPMPCPGWVQREFEASYKDGFDLLFLGSSHIQRSFDPRFFDALGIKSFTFGTPAQTPLNTYFLLESLDEKLNAKRVVLEVFPNLFKVSGAESFIDLYGSMPELATSGLRHAWATRDKRSFIGLGLKELRVANFVASSSSLVDSQITRGYLDFKHSRSTDFSQFVPGDLDATEQLKYFDKVLQTLQKRAIKTIIIITPLANGLIECMPDYHTDIAEINKVCERYGLEVVDFNRIEQFDDSLFWDVNHLNKRGVEKFLPLFYSEMLRRQSLPSSYDDGHPQ